MKTKIDTIREALNVSRAGDKAMCREDYVDMIDEAHDALSDLEAQQTAHPQTEDYEERAREWWVVRKAELERTAVNPGSVFPQSESELTKDFAAFARSLSLSTSKGVEAQVEEIMAEHRKWIRAQIGAGPEDSDWKADEWKVAEADFRARLKNLLAR